MPPVVHFLGMGKLFTSIVVAAGSLAASVRAQQLAWQLPSGGAVEYRREWRAAASAPLKTNALAKAAPLDAKVPDKYLSRLAPAPWLCQGELREDQRAVAGPVRDLRDAMRAIAFDLGARTAVRVRFPRLLPFGDVLVTGTWSTADAEGAQTLEASFAAAPAAAARGEGKLVVARLAEFCIADAAGRLQLTRRVDAERGLVVAFAGNFDLVAAEDTKSHRRVVVDDRWQLVAVREQQDFDFRKRVAAAITAGVGWVRDAIDEQKSFLVERGGDDRNYGSGRLALGLLTMLHGHVPRDDAVLQRGFAELRRRTPEDSYSLAAALMAIDALHTPPGEAARLREGTLAAPSVHPLPDRDRQIAQKWLDTMLKNVDPRGAAADALRFNYTAGPRYDTSLQQYGLLGMWAAQTSGLDLPPRAFAAAGRHLLAVQGPGAGSHGLTLTTYTMQRDAAGSDAPLRVPVQRATVRGFAYQEASEPPFGSMTSAGISGLLLARAGMAARGEVDRALVARFDDAIRDGFAWLATEFSVRVNPGFAERADNHWYYWLYGLERSCELAGVAQLDGRDWYYEGGLQLLAQQQANGSFRAEHPSTLLLDSTCFAVLFLAKSTAAAAVTGR